MRGTIRMQRSIFSLIVWIAAATFVSVPRATSQATNWQQIPIPNLPVFHPPQPKRIQFSNGMVIFLQEDHELPLISGTARIRGGSSSEPAAKVGLVDIFGEVWRTGGAKTHTGGTLEDALEVRAPKSSTSPRSRRMTASRGAMTKSEKLRHANPPSWRMERTIPTRESPSIPPSQPSLVKTCSTGTRPTFIPITSFWV